MSSKRKSSVEEWMRFFKDAGIPKDFVTNYAIIFNNHRMRMDMLQDLNKDVLHDMGIKTMGDVIAIMRHAKVVVENETRSKILASSGRSRSTSSSPTGTPARNVRTVDGTVTRNMRTVDGTVTRNMRTVDGTVARNMKTVDGNVRTVDGSPARNMKTVDGPVIIDRRSAANLPPNNETKRSISGTRMTKHRQEVSLQDRIGFKVASTGTFGPGLKVASTGTFGSFGSGIPASLARRLGPIDKKPVTAPGSDESAVRRVVTGLDSGDGGSGHSLSLPSPSSFSPSFSLHSSNTSASKRVVIGTNGSSSSSNSVFSRLGTPSTGRITATVKPTTVVPTTVVPTTVVRKFPANVARKSLARDSAAPYSVHDRLGNKVSTVDSFTKMTKSDSQRPKMVPLKKSVFDRLN